jgi:tRNA U55 pseudouridine synthase TruB
MFLIDTLHLDWKGEEILDVYKPFGSTPKEMADQVKKITNAKKVAFSGRLDPMAHGILRVFLNNACGSAEKTNYVNKVYKFKFAFGLSTSSGDLLGFCKIFTQPKPIILEDIVLFLKKIQQNYMQKVPVHSSFPVMNKEGEKHPLWWWAKYNRLMEVDIPYFLRKLFSFHIIGFDEICLPDLVSMATERISKISILHEFNQKEIINAWKDTIKENEKIISFVTFEMCATVSSGFYIRQLVTDIGRHLDIPTTTLEIERIAYC